jgi:hypothetical protein
MMDHNTLGEIFQEIIVELSEMGPTNLDTLEKKVREVLRRLGAGMMQWKLGDWDTELRKEICSECNSKLENRKRDSQIVTVVADVNYQRYRSSCPDCGKVEYPLDSVLGLRPYQRLSWLMEELSVLCGSSWKYEEAESIMEKFLGRRVSHETIFNKTTEAGKAGARQGEGVQIKELEYDKKLQGEHFDNMEVWEQPAERIYTDMDGVLINCRDGTKRMEGKVAIVWSQRELVKSDTYSLVDNSLVDKRAMGTFTDPERFYWDVTAEGYKRSGGKMDAPDSLVRGDGAAFIRGFHSTYAPDSRYLLDHYHMCEKVKQRISGSVYEDKERCKEVRETIISYLESDDVDAALEYIHALGKRFRKRYKKEQLRKLAGYIERNRHGIWYKEAREKGISIGAGSADKAGDILICRRMKLRGMRWSRVGADGVLAIRILVYNREWDDFWSKHKEQKAA